MCKMTWRYLWEKDDGYTEEFRFVFLKTLEKVLHTTNIYIYIYIYNEVSEIFLDIDIFCAMIECTYN